MLKLEIVTPAKRVLDETVDSVTVPTANGEIGILTNHAPLISSLKSGVLAYTQGGVTNKMVVSGGFVEVGVNKVSVLADLAETAEEIDVPAARADKEEAEKLLGSSKDSAEEFDAAQDKLERAQARLTLAAGK